MGKDRDEPLNPALLDPSLPSVGDGDFYKQLDGLQQRRLDEVVRSYVEKLGEADWFNSDRIRENENWAEAQHQARLIENRLKEISSNTNPKVGRERAFLKAYARELMSIYDDTGGPVPGLPIELRNIFRLEYPGPAALLRLLALEEKRPMSKWAAIDLVKQVPHISAGALARELCVSKGTIKNWEPDLKAAGWNGPRIDSESIQTSKRKRQQPSLPNLKFMEGDGPEGE